MGIRYFQRRFAANGWYGLQPQSAKVWRKVLDILGHACLKCGRKPVTRDHIVPLSSGGLNHPTNLQPLCQRCNNRKANRTIDYRTQEQRAAVLNRWPLRNLPCPLPDGPDDSGCIDRTQCWEPCGDLGKSAAHAVAANETLSPLSE